MTRERKRREREREERERDKDSANCAGEKSFAIKYFLYDFFSGDFSREDENYDWILDETPRGEYEYKKEMDTIMLLLSFLGEPLSYSLFVLFITS